MKVKKNGMKSIKIEMSDLEYDQLGLATSTLSFSELINIITKRINKQILERSIQLAGKYGLSKMTMDGINEEIDKI